MRKGILSASRKGKDVALATVEVLVRVCMGELGVTPGSTDSTKGLPEFKVTNLVAGTAKAKNSNGKLSQYTTSKFSASFA